MRWHVHGLDAVTGQPVELKVDAAQAQGAVKSAMERQIIVSYVTPAEAMRRPWRRPAAAASFVAVVGVAVGLAVQNWSMRGTLRQAQAEQKQLSSSAAQAENLAADNRAQGSLADDARAKVVKLQDELAAMRSSASATEARLTMAHRETSGLQAAAARVPGLEKQMTELHGELIGAQNKVAVLQTDLGGAQAQLVDSRRTAEQLRGELLLQGRRLEQLEKVAAAAGTAGASRVAELEAATQKLKTENDALKNELLLLAAQPKPVATAPVTEVVPAAPGRWALGVAFDTARTFVSVHSDPETVGSTSLGEGLVASMGVLPANAVQVRFVHDRAKERVYSATLTVSLAADGPREKLAENRAIIGAFLVAFAPGLKDAEAVVTGATGQLAAADDTRRLVYLAQDGKVTVWNNKGTYTFRVESVRGELE